MRNLTVTILLVTLIPNILVSQKIDTIYYDNNWNLSTSEKYKYYRIVKQNSNKVEVADYYKSGQIQMSGAYKNQYFSEVVGPFHYYKKNKLVHLQLYQPNNYPEVLAKFSEQLKYLEILSDTFSLNVFFNNKGRIKSIGYMIDKCTYHGPWLFFVGKSQYPSSLTEFQNNIRNGKYIFYDRNGLPAISGQYKSDKKNGAWECSHDGKIVFTDYWFDGKKIKTISY